ncbi:MAG: methyltransferase domain-containing protein [Planctomycetota bacterium]
MNAPLFNIPISPEKADRLIEMLDLAPSSHVLDVGCGRGEFLLRVIEATGASGLGVDIDAGEIRRARQSASERVGEARCEFREANIQQEQLADESFDLAVCLGSTHAFGMGEPAYANAIEAMTRLVKPGGQLLIGESYWKQTPSPEYLALIGDPVGVYRDHAANVSFVEERGLVAMYAATSSEDEWDHFEWSHRLMAERRGIAAPGDPQVAHGIQHSRRWLDGYLRWGRSTMGFGFYLFTKPANGMNANPSQQ